MGTDISGWVEFRDAGLDELAGETLWCPVIDAGWLLRRDYKAFGVLFGVRNSTGFVPVAAGRDLPDDVSETVRQNAAWEFSHSHSFISWREIREIQDRDRTETSENTFVCEYQLSEPGKWIRLGVLRPSTSEHHREGDTWNEGDRWFRIERITRPEALEDAGFPMVFEMMASLAKRYGDENVRLVVWFDN